MLLSNPVYLILIISVFIASLLYTNFFKPSKNKNPFETDSIRTPDSFITDHSERDKFLKCGFAEKRLVSAYDAIVIGSGIGGLSAAACLSKSGKKVLVLEQHDQAGGCCHTFIEKGFEFDVGVHYIGEMNSYSLTRLLFDQLTDGQLQWNRIDEEFDKLVIGGAKSGMPLEYFPIVAGNNFRKSLLAQFPDEETAIDEYLKLLLEAKKGMSGFFIVKLLPKILVKFLIHSKILNLMSGYFKRVSSKTVQQVTESLTSNKKLQLVFAYSFGDYGVIPEDASWAMHALLVNHYMKGAYYPIGGGSEIPLHIIRNIKKSGGNVLVRAPVSKIMVDSNGKAYGVEVAKGDGTIKITAPLIISDAGISNTLMRLLPEKVAEKIPLYKSLNQKEIKPAWACLSLFVGLNSTAEKLQLKAQNIWSYPNENVNFAINEFNELDFEDICNSDFDLPVIFIGFPSAKDPNFEKRFPGKATCTVVSFANWKWFSQWDDARVKKRGVEYENFKRVIQEQMWKQVTEIYPQLKDNVDYMDLGTPVSNNFYIGTTQGETYGLHHGFNRFADPSLVMNLRPDIGIENLLITGQDIFSCGVVGAAFGGVLCASKALNRNLLFDLLKLKKQLKRKDL